MILYIASFFLFIFVCVNLVYKTNLTLNAKIAICVIVFIISMKYEIYQFLGGAFFAPQLPRPLLLFMEACYGAFIMLCFLFLLYDVYLLGNWLLAKIGFPVPRHLPLGYIRCGLVALALVLGIWGTWQAVKIPHVKEIRLEIKNLPAGLNGFTLVQLTDLHIGPILKKDWLEGVVSKVNALQPDLILMTGDYIDGYVKDIGGELAPLENLQAKYGVWGVTGNHEYYWNMSEWVEALKNLNIRILHNEHVALNINNDTLVLAGIPDLAASRFGLEEPNLQKALRGKPDAPAILLSHQPKFAEAMSKEVDLILSGHTHGGLMFFLQPLIARFNSGFVAGMYPVGDSNVYVSPGTALWNGFSCRIGVPAEITKITLAPKG